MATRTNQYRNPRFHNYATGDGSYGWFLSGTGATVSREASPPRTLPSIADACAELVYGSATLYYQSATASGGSGLYMTASPDEVVTVRGYVDAEDAAGNVYWKIQFYNASNVSLKIVDGAAISGSGWQRITRSATAPADTAYYKTYFQLLTGGTLYVTGFISDSDDAYFDGDTADGGGWVYDWTGTAHNSSSTATEVGGIPKHSDHYMRRRAA